MMMNSTLGVGKFTDGVPGAAGGAGNICSACVIKCEEVCEHDLLHKNGGLPSNRNFIYIQDLKKALKM